MTSKIDTTRTAGVANLKCFNYISHKKRTSKGAFFYG